jgi:very-short-patch-repair endonuclease
MNGYFHDDYRSGNKDRARKLRSEPTIAEKTVWKYILGATKTGFTFKKQRNIGPFFADFSCQKLKLAIELDGESHNLPETQARDAAKEKYLDRLGYKTIRFQNIEVEKNLEGVARYINQVIKERAVELGVEGRQSKRG